MVAGSGRVGDRGRIASGVKRSGPLVREGDVDDAPVAEVELGAGFEGFYREHHADAVRWAAALVGRTDVAADLAHDVLLRVGARLDRIDEPTAYLRRSIVNACRSWHRAAAREVVAELDDAPGRLAPATVEVLDVLALLPYQQRAVLVLRYWADWATPDIAAALGCREATVRVHAHRGLRTLRGQLGPEEER